MTEEPAVRSTLGDHPLLARRLRGRIEQRKAELTDQLRVATSWDDFNKRRGVVEGLAQAVALCEQTERELNER